MSISLNSTLFDSLAFEARMPLWEGLFAGYRASVEQNEVPGSETSYWSLKNENLSNGFAVYLFSLTLNQMQGEFAQHLSGEEAPTNVDLSSDAPRSAESIVYNSLDAAVTSVSAQDIETPIVEAARTEEESQAGNAPVTNSISPDSFSQLITTIASNLIDIGDGSKGDKAFADLLFQIFGEAGQGNSNSNSNSNGNNFSVSAKKKAEPDTGPEGPIFDQIAAEIREVDGIRSFRGVEIPTLEALVAAVENGTAQDLISKLLKSISSITSELSYNSGDGDAEFSLGSLKARQILLFILDLKPSTVLNPVEPTDPNTPHEPILQFVSAVTGVYKLKDLISKLDLPTLDKSEIQFGDGILIGGVSRYRLGDNLVFAIDNGDGTTSTVTILGYYVGDTATKITKVNFADGTSALIEDIVEGPVTGTDNSEVLYGTDGDDEINALGGDDRIMGSLGADTIDGGEGTDTVDLSESSEGQTINLITNVNVGGLADGDTYSNIENVVGSNTADDDITGSTGNNELFGMGGSDILRGHNGDDILRGGLGNDYLFGGRGADVLDGGSGIDWAMYTDSDTGVNVDLLGTGSGGYAEGDTYLSIERVSGSSHNDTINMDHKNNKVLGNDGDDVINGLGGNDNLDGGNDNDRLNGGTGFDILTGGVGADTFVFEFGSSEDEITDFENDIDTIELDDELWGGAVLTEQEVVDTYGTQISATEIQLDFGNGDVLTITSDNPIDLVDLYDDLVLI